MYCFQVISFSKWKQNVLRHSEVQALWLYDNNNNNNTDCNNNNRCHFKCHVLLQPWLIFLNCIADEKKKKNLNHSSSWKAGTSLSVIPCKWRVMVQYGFIRTSVSISPLVHQTALPAQYKCIFVIDYNLGRKAPPPRPPHPAHINIQKSHLTPVTPGGKLCAIKRDNPCICF